METAFRITEEEVTTARAFISHRKLPRVENDWPGVATINSWERWLEDIGFGLSYTMDRDCYITVFLKVVITLLSAAELNRNLSPEFLEQLSQWLVHDCVEPALTQIIGGTNITEISKNTFNVNLNHQNKVSKEAFQFICSDVINGMNDYLNTDS